MEAKAITGILSQKSDFSFCAGERQQNCDVQHFPGTKGLIVGLEQCGFFSQDPKMPHDCCSSFRFSHALTFRSCNGRPFLKHVNQSADPQTRRPSRV